MRDHLEAEAEAELWEVTAARPLWAMVDLVDNRKARRCLQRQIGKLCDRKTRRWLQRHGRHCQYIIGWDGNPPELPPMFQRDDFSRAYHTLVSDVAKEITASCDPLVQADAEQHKSRNYPTWSEQHWQPHSSFSIFNTSTQQHPTNQTLTGPESSDEEGEPQDEEGGRAVKQALKREVPWRAISSEDRPKFVVAMAEEWEEWVKWASCKPVSAKKRRREPFQTNSSCEVAFVIDGSQKTEADGTNQKQD